MEMEQGRELHWLAGLLEGEGSFMSGPPSNPGSPLVRVEMTDRDVILRVAAFWNRAMAVRQPKNPRHKFAYATALKGRDAVALMTVLKPLMGNRRQQAIGAAIRSARGYQSRQLLTDREVEKVRSLLASGSSAPDLAMRLGVSKSLIYKIGSGNKRAVPVHIVGQEWDEVHADAWLAGLLEGEGTFGLGPPAARHKVRVSVHMTDYDVISRAGALLGTPAIQRCEPQNERWSVTYKVSVSHRRAVSVTHRVIPYLGVRRTQAANRLIEASAKAPGPPSRLITPVQEMQIHLRHLSGESIRSLARDYEVAERTVYAAWQRARHRLALEARPSKGL